MAKELSAKAGILGNLAATPECVQNNQMALISQVEPSNSADSYNKF